MEKGELFGQFMKKFDSAISLWYTIIVRKLLPLIILVLSLILGLGVFFKTQAQEIGRAYFRIKSEITPPLIAPYLRHDFGDRVFSLEAPLSVIEKLKDNPNLEFRGMASLWQISDIPNAPSTPNLSETLSHRQIAATCSPSEQRPWGILKVNGGQATAGAGLKVAVVDTGVKKDHPDLAGNIADCRDAQNSLLRARCNDGNGHGTHVTGTIAANGKILGVAPAAKIIAIKVCSDRGFCWSDDVARGIRYAADQGANVISISLGGSTITQDEKNAVSYAVSKGSLIVAAAGNSGPADNTILYPAALPQVVAVGATNSTDGIANWSSRGNNYATGDGILGDYLVEERDIEFAAPGVSVESTWKDGCYYFGSGTSMATPHVSGLAAKLWQASASATRDYLQNRARYDYSDIGRTGDDPDAGFGLPTAP